VPADAWGGNGWSFWQYTSSGSVPGITGRVDLDRFNGTDFTRVRIP
jgi:lysozyme